MVRDGPAGLILDWAGVLTTNMVEVIDSFEARVVNSIRGILAPQWTRRG